MTEPDPFALGGRQDTVTPKFCRYSGNGARLGAQQPQ